MRENGQENSKLLKIKKSWIFCSRTGPVQLFFSETKHRKDPKSKLPRMKEE